MKKLSKGLITMALFGTLIAPIGCGAKPTPTPEPTATPTPAAVGVIVLGKVSDKPAEKIEKYQPLADYLAANLGDFGIGVGEVRVAPDLETMARWMASGEVDLFFDNPYAALIVSDLSGGHPALFRVKEGAAEKRANFFVRADSGITSLANLAGQMIALEEHSSSAGYMLPLVHLIQASMNPVEKADPDSRVAADEVGYVFSWDDDNTVQWVLSGRVAAGVVDDEAYEEFSEENPGVLALLAETEWITRHQLGVVRPSVAPPLMEAIVTLLVDLDETEDGPAIMEPSKTERFDDLSEEWEAALTRIQEMYELIQIR